MHGGVAQGVDRAEVPRILLDDLGGLEFLGGMIHVLKYRQKGWSCHRDFVSANPADKTRPKGHAWPTQQRNDGPKRVHRPHQHARKRYYEPRVRGENMGKYYEPRVRGENMGKRSTNLPKQRRNGPQWLQNKVKNKVQNGLPYMTRPHIAGVGAAIGSTAGDTAGLVVGLDQAWYRVRKQCRRGALPLFPLGRLPALACIGESSANRGDPNNRVCTHHAASDPHGHSRARQQ